jgi:hypothetical protein
MSGLLALGLDSKFVTFNKMRRCVRKGSSECFDLTGLPQRSPRTVDRLFSGALALIARVFDRFHIAEWLFSIQHVQRSDRCSIDRLEHISVHDRHAE